MAHSISAAALFIYFPYSNRRALFAVILKYLLYLVMVVAGSYLFARLIPESVEYFVALMVNGCVILIMMFALLFILRLEERLFVRQYWQKAVGFIR